MIASSLSVVQDAVELARISSGGDVSLRSVVRAAVMLDSFVILTTTRARQLARRARVPLVNRTLRLAQTALYGIEIGKDVELGRGIFFVHTVGTVIGGDARLGDRVKLMGNNTIGTARGDGYPVIEDDVVIGVGARVLGPITVGARSVIGANAVVLESMPPDSFAVGVPAVVRARTRGGA